MNTQLVSLYRFQLRVGQKGRERLHDRLGNYDYCLMVMCVFHLTLGF